MEPNLICIHGSPSPGRKYQRLWWIGIFTGRKSLLCRQCHLKLVKSLTMMTQIQGIQSLVVLFYQFQTGVACHLFLIRYLSDGLQHLYCNKYIKNTCSFAWYCTCICVFETMKQSSMQGLYNCQDCCLTIHCLSLHDLNRSLSWLLRSVQIRVIGL